MHNIVYIRIATQRLVLLKERFIRQRYYALWGCSMENEPAAYNIKVTSSVKKRLDAMKIHHKEPYWEVITRLLEYMDKQELTSP
jgi:hypothetical protein